MFVHNSITRNGARQDLGVIIKLNFLYTGQSRINSCRCRPYWLSLLASARPLRPALSNSAGCWLVTITSVAVWKSEHTHLHRRTNIHGTGNKCRSVSAEWLLPLLLPTTTDDDVLPHYYALSCRRTALCASCLYGYIRSLCALYRQQSGWEKS